MGEGGGGGWGGKIQIIMSKFIIKLHPLPL